MAHRLISAIFANRSVTWTPRNLQNLKTQLRYYPSRSISQIKSQRGSVTYKKILAAVCCFGMSGGAYAYFTTTPQAKNLNISKSLIEVADPYVLAHSPITKATRQVAGPANLELDLMLYQYQNCPFCCKVRAFLDFYGIPYEVVEVNPVMRQQIKFSKYKKVPILVVQDRKTNTKLQLNDSSVIISILGTFLLNNYSQLQDVLKFYIPVTYTNEEGRDVIETMNQYFLMYGENEPDNSKKYKEINEERKWRKWADNEFVHVLSPNIYRSPKEAFQAFRYFSDVGEWEKNFTMFERLSAVYIGATAMYFIGKKLRKKYSLKEDVRESLYDYCRMWMKNVGKSKFMGGESPNLADLAVYGLLGSIEGCNAFQDALEHTTIGKWYDNMKESVKKHHGFDTTIKSMA